MDLQVCRVSFQQKSSTLRRSKRRGRQTVDIINFPNKLADARRRDFHFEQLRSRYATRWQSYERGEDGRTDRQTDQTDGFSALYTRLANVPALSCRST